MVTVPDYTFSQGEHRALSRRLRRRLGLPPHWLHGASLADGSPDLDNPTALVVLMLLSPPDVVVVDDGCAYRARLGMLETVEHETPGRALADLLGREVACG